jgi:hypothetical protein
MAWRHMGFVHFSEVTRCCHLESAMNGTPKINRARRNALKAGGLILGAVLATGVPHRRSLSLSATVLAAFLTFFATSFAADAQ